MKKMKRPAKEPFPNPPGRSFENPRDVLKHQSLLQDFAELFEESEEKKKRLEMMKQNRLVLLAEVKFLRRRYKYLAESQSLNVNNGVQLQQKSMLFGRSMERGKKSGAAVAVSQRQASRPDPKQKGKICDGTDLALHSHLSAFDFGQRQKTTGKEAATSNSNLNQTERISSAAVASARKDPPISDLNEITREEEELQAEGDKMIGNDSMFSALRVSIDQQLDEMKSSACRQNAGNGTSLTRKRRKKISWQNPVALRVGILSPLT